MARTWVKHHVPCLLLPSGLDAQFGTPYLRSAGFDTDIHVDAQPSNDNDVEIEPVVDLDNPPSKNQRYDKRDFVFRKHGKEREPWVKKPMPFPPKPSQEKG